MPMPDNVKSKISELEKELYSKDFKQHRVEDVFSREKTDVALKWDKEKDDALFLREELRSEKRHHIMKKFTQFSIGFFVIAVAVALFIWWRGSNVVSGEKIDISISQPSAVSGGDPFETKFIITNNNTVFIDEATLLIEYPTGFYSVSNNTDLLRVSKTIGSIAHGQAISETVDAVLYGQENTSKEILVTLEYRMSGSNATLKKNTTYEVRILSSPVNVNFKMLKEISSGQDVVIPIEIESNSKNIISNLVVEAGYPIGFNFKSSQPAPSYNMNSWQLAGLKPQEKRTITIRGVIEGQENEEKVTKISVGTQSPADERLIGIVYNVATESSIITKPFLALDLAVNNVKSQENIASLNKGVRVDLFWQSNNSAKITDAVIEVNLKGVALDKYSLYASGGGYYRSVDNTIVWDKTGNHELSVINPGTSGTVSFSFSPVAISADTARLIKNPQIIFEVRARGWRMSNKNALEDASTSITRSVKFETDIRVGAKGLFFSGPFQNIGPIPPQVDKETTYTIVLTAQNSSNNISNTVVKTTLPIYVKWLGKVDPEGEDITWNDSTGEVTWNVGRVASGGSRDASFQISFTPSVSHINRAPLLTGDITISAMDDFTKTEVRDKKPALTTYIFGDPQFSPNDANVVN
ncbi:MAG: hypothetical protein WAV98_02865 [Minisyncoccia bacterium]